MAVQIEVDEMQGCPCYLEWILGVVTGKNEKEELVNTDELRSTAQRKVDDNLRSTAQRKVDDNLRNRSSIEDICRLMFEVDFICCGDDATIKNDEIRAKDAMELRRKYAEIVGKNTGKSEREVDRIWKSVHGKCSVLELILSICYRLDAMVNEDDSEGMVGYFFGILVNNLGFEWDLEYKPDDPKLWNLDVIHRFIGRGYEKDGSGGGLFPLKKWSAEAGSKDQRAVSIWYQMGTWLDEHLDDEAHFVE